MLKKGGLKIGVSGIGSIGFRHTRLLSKRPDVELYICDPVFEHVQACSTLGSVVGSTDNFADLLKWPLDGVVVATPDRFHLEQTIAACKKGVPVLLEKPIAEDMGQGCKLLKAAQDTGTPVLVGYALRYAKCMIFAKKMLDEGQIGSPVSFQVMLGTYETLIFAKNRFSPTDRNKLFVDYSHEWDYLQWFLGPIGRVVALSHQSGQLELTQNPNVVDGLIEMKNGISGSVHLDYVQLPGRRHVVLIGDQGTVEVDAVRNSVTLSRRGESYKRNYEFPEHRDDVMERQHDHFLEIIRDGRDPTVTIGDGLKALSVADALIRSTQSGLWELVGDLELKG